MPDPNGSDMLEKDLPLEAIRRSIQAVPGVYDSPGAGDFTLFIASAADAIQPWGRNWQLRDRELRAFWPTEPVLAGTVTSTAMARASYSFKLDGPPRTVSRVMDMIQNADRGQGIVSLMIKTNHDLLTEDNGAFWEVVRAADGPDAPVIGLEHLDAAHCVRTGNPEFPVVFTDPRNGKLHRLAWYQVVTWAERPSPITLYNGMQYSALTCILRASQLMRDTLINRHERAAGRYTRAIHFVGGVASSKIDDIEKREQERSDNLGLARHMQPLIIASLDPSKPVTTATLDMAALPEGFDLDKEVRWYIAELALAFGGDYQDLAPLPGGNLGTSAQSEVLNRKSRGKGPAVWMKTVLHKMNFHGLLPRSVTWEFDERDIASEQEDSDLLKTRAEADEIRINSGVLTPLIVRQQMVDAGDLKPEYLALLGEEDVTPDTTLTDESGQDAADGVEAQPVTEMVAPLGGAAAKFFRGALRKAAETWTKATVAGLYASLRRELRAQVRGALTGQVGQSAFEDGFYFALQNSFPESYRLGLAACGVEEPPEVEEQRELDAAIMES